MSLTIRRRALVGLAGIALLVIGIATGALWMKHRLGARVDVSDGGNASLRPGSAPSEVRDEPLEVSLTPEAIQRASIKTTTVRTAVASTTMTVPGTVTSNAYRDLKVNALVGGVIRQVRPELGASPSRVSPGTSRAASSSVVVMGRYGFSSSIFTAMTNRRRPSSAAPSDGLSRRQKYFESLFASLTRLMSSRG